MITDLSVDQIRTRRPHLFAKVKQQGEKTPRGVMR